MSQRIIKSPDPEVNNITLLNSVTATGRSSNIPVVGTKTFTFEVYGTASTFTVQIEGQSFSGTPYVLSVTNLNSLTNSTSITSAGLYQVSVEGLVNVDANVTAVSGGSLTLQGTLVV